MINKEEPKSIKKIQVFLGFANFYQRFFKAFSKIIASFTSMLKTRKADMTPIVDPADRREEVEKKVESQASFLLYVAKLAFT